MHPRCIFVTSCACIAERDKAVADNVRILSESRSITAAAVEKALAAREKLITGDGIHARSAAQIRIDDLEKTNRKLQVAAPLTTEP